MDLTRLSREELEHEVRAARLAREARDASAARGRRRTDPPHEDHRGEREDDMTTERSEDLRTWPGRVKAAWIVINQPGGLAILLLGIGLALYTGYLPSPVTRTEAKVDQHIANVDRIVQVRSEEQRELVGALKRLTEEISRRNARDRIRECAEIRDLELRRECLRT